MDKVLLIDDEADVQYSFRRIFDNPEIELLTAASGEEGLQLIPNLKPDLVIMDVRMGGMTGLETLRQLSQPGVYEKLAGRTAALVAGLRECARDAGVDFSADSLGGMFGFYFHAGPVRNFQQAKQADAARFRVFFAAMLAAGIYLPPSPFEAGFVSLAHGKRDIEQTLEAARNAMLRVARIQ